MDRQKDIYKELSKRVLVLDGAMGTMIQRYRLTENDYRGERFKGHPADLMGNHDLLSVTRPDIIREIHEAYLEAGADIIETNTFNCTAISQADYCLESEVYEINRAAAQVACYAAGKFTALNPDRPRFVAGAMGPTSKTASLSQDVNDPGSRVVSFDGFYKAYHEQARGLIDGGVDLLLVETITDIDIARAAMDAIFDIMREQEIGLPVMISVTLKDKDRLPSGQAFEDLLLMAGGYPLLSVGFNCVGVSVGLEPRLKALAATITCCTSVHPSAGIPDDQGSYHDTPEDMMLNLDSLLEEGLLNFAGGCCGTTPEFIAMLEKVAAKATPRQISR